MLKNADDADGNYHRTEKWLVIASVSECSVDENQEDSSGVLIALNGNNMLKAEADWLAKLNWFIGFSNTYRQI